MDKVDPAFFCPENVFFICYIHMKEKNWKKHTIPIDMVCLWVYSNTNTEERT